MEYDWEGQTQLQVLRPPATAAIVEGTFVVSAAHSAPIQSLLAVYRAPCVDEPIRTLVLRRQIQSKGEGGGVRSLCFAGGAPVPLKALKALGATLLDVNGQVSSSLCWVTRCGHPRLCNNWVEGRLANER